MSSYPQAFLDLLGADTKEINLVIQFDGIDTLFSLMPVYKTFRYGDPYHYGDPSLVYGGLVPVANVKAIISPQSNLVISQKIEPEQGRGSAGTFTIDFVDVDGFMSSFVSPGVIFDELLGSKQAKFFIGHKNSSFKEDYLCIFRGYVTMTTMLPTKISLQFTDANIKRKQQIFYTTPCLLNADINDTATTLTLDRTDGIIQYITGPGGGYDSSLRLFLRIGDEYMEYLNTATITTTTINVNRGSLGTTRVAHSTGDTVDNYILLTGNILDIALKIMLGGWDGPCLTGIKIKSFNYTYDPSIGTIANAIVLPDGQNADVDYGITAGDYITVTGSASNNSTFVVTGFLDANGYPNSVILVDGPTVLEPTTSGVFSLRSKYDVYPTQIGNALKVTDVDVTQWENIRDTFVFQPDCTFELLIHQAASGKQWIESELLLPAGLYGVTRFGRISVSATKPPIAGADLQTISINNIINPQNISITRGLNNRRYYSEVQYNFDFDYISDKALNSLYRLNTDSLTRFDTSSPLPITAHGLRTTHSASTFVDRRAKFILGRYQYAAFEISLNVLFKIGAVLEVSDVVILKDNGTLQITNLNTGLRDLGTQLFEVIERTLDLKGGMATLKLMSVLDYQINDRFAAIAPSSQIATATTTQVQIKDSFGARFPLQEYKKWTEIIGEKIRIRSPDYTYDHTVTLLGFDSVNLDLMNVTPALPSAPLANYIVELAQYDDVATVDPNSKLLYVFSDFSDLVVTGTSNLIFTVADGSRYLSGDLIKVHNTSYTNNSENIAIDTVVGNTITMKSSLGFTPSTGDKIELVHFIDQSGPFRIL